MNLIKNIAILGLAITVVATLYIQNKQSGIRSEQSEFMVQAQDFEKTKISLQLEREVQATRQKKDYLYLGYFAQLDTLPDDLHIFIPHFLQVTQNAIDMEQAIIDEKDQMIQEFNSELQLFTEEAREFSELSTIKMELINKMTQMANWTFYISFTLLCVTYLVELFRSRD